MKTLIYCLMGAGLLFACSKKKDFSIDRDAVLITDGVEKTKEGYVKALSGHWRVDTASARKELLLLSGAVADRVAGEKGDDRLGPKWRELFELMSKPRSQVFFLPLFL